MKAAASLVLVSLVVLAGCAGKTASDRWFIARNDLTVAERAIRVAHVAGWVGDDAVLSADPLIKAARAGLDEAAAYLPGGGRAYEAIMASLTRLIAELQARGAASRGGDP